MTELDRTVEYTYDSLYRLTSETITEGEKVTGYTYAYDNVSNRILKTENGAATEYVYNALNQLVLDSETSYEYDLNGNLIRVIGSAQSALYEYNSENKLVKATVQNGVLVTEETYTYDYSGNRTSKTTHRSDGVTEYVKYINDNSSLTNVLAEIGSEGSVQAYYTIGADLISQERDGNVSVFLYDGHGSVVGLANESGVVTDTYSYDAFGNLLKSKGSTKNCYRYCGEQFDETTGLYYLRARYMDTSTGRFISQDTYQGTINDPVSLHKYLYANSNPVTYSDPSGYMSMAGLAVRGAVIGALSGLIVPNAVSIIRNLVTTGEFKSDLSPMQNLANILNGVIFGALFGICAATFIAYGIIAGVAVSINFSLAYGCYIDGQNAAAAGQWDIAICSWFFCLFYLIAGFTTISLSYLSNSTNGSNTTSASDRQNSWYKRNGEINYPPNNGAVPGTEKVVTLNPGDRIGRYGNITPTSTFVTKPGASSSQLSLPPNTDPSVYQEFIVIKPIVDAEAAIIAPWGNSCGGGIQYNLPNTLQWLIDNGYLIPVG